MTAPDFDALAAPIATEIVNDLVEAGELMDAETRDDAHGHWQERISALLRSVHASRDAEVKAAREQGIREAADLVMRIRFEEGAGLDASYFAQRIDALLNAPKGG